MLRIGEDPTRMKVSEWLRQYQLTGQIPDWDWEAL